MSGGAEQYFYAPGLESGIYTFDTFESRHIRKVLRKRPGYTLWLTDGEGNLFEAVITAMDKQAVTAAVRNRQSFPRPSKRLHVYIAPPKLPARFEWFLEKAVELGVWQITPVITRHTQAFKWKPERFEKIVITALKQAKRVYKPVLRPPEKLERIVPPELPAYVALCEAEKYFNRAYVEESEAAVFIGPEGGFSPDEKELFSRNHIKPVRLSGARLRTETAGITAVCMFHATVLME